MIRINRVKLMRNKILGDVEIKFYSEEKNFDSIIFAGENGSGKTKIIEGIYYLLSMDTFTYVDKFLESDYIGKYAELELDISDLNYYSNDDRKEKIEKCCLIFQKNGFNNFFYTDKGRKTDSYINNKGEVEYIFSKLNTFYSTVNINYNPKRTIEGVTNKTLDDEDNLSSDDIAGDIIQLLVDISVQDALDLKEWAENNKGKVIPENIYSKRMNRFTRAFDIMFQGKIKFKTIHNNTIPIFEKNGKEIEISSLSSGEKQIIYRGVSILKNINLLNNNPIFIDEPEISMHPKWEQKILSYYKALVTDKKGIQTSQLFIATHSEHMLKESIESENDMIIKLNQSNNYSSFYKQYKGGILPTMTLAEIKYSIFDLHTTDFHILLYGYIQNNFVRNSKGELIDEANITQTDKWLLNKGAPRKKYLYKSNYYETLPTFIRNCIDHPDNQYKFNDQELKESEAFMISLIKQKK